MSRLNVLPLESSEIRRVERRCSLNQSKLKCPPVGVEWKLGEGVQAQMSFSSLDHGLKLRGPLHKALVQLNRVTFSFTRQVDEAAVAY
ncbi:hypothetical protein TNCV_5043261 [Trichonephila clavipes]|nr:hypothetical protein TNCV_5043261 [Trichonephila clavipes]